MLVADNCPAHGDVEGLEAIRFKFLLPNITAALQPLVQGVIKNLKVQYRKLPLKRVLLCMNSGMLYNITPPTSTGMLANVWEALMATAIRKCFQHTFSISGSHDTVPDSSPQIHSEDETDDLMVSAFEARNISVDICPYSAVDDDPCVCRDDTVDDIVQEVVPAE